VIESLADVMVMKGVPEHIRSDNGPEFVAKDLRKWLADTGAKTLYNGCNNPFLVKFLRQFRLIGFRRRETWGAAITSGFTRQPPRTPKSGDFSAAVFAECVGDVALVEVTPGSSRSAAQPPHIMILLYWSHGCSGPQNQCLRRN
jgi:hypothetical protein